MAHSESFNPSLPERCELHYLISKRDGMLTVAEYDKFYECYAIAGWEGTRSKTWISTHFYIHPLEIPKQILELSYARIKE